VTRVFDERFEVIDCTERQLYTAAEAAERLRRCLDDERAVPVYGVASHPCSGR